jgi:hypothetical protein
MIACKLMIYHNLGNGVFRSYSYHEPTMLGKSNLSSRQRWKIHQSQCLRHSYAHPRSFGLMVLNLASTNNCLQYCNCSYRSILVAPSSPSRLSSRVSSAQRLERDRDLSCGCGCQSRAHHISTAIWSIAEHSSRGARLTEIISDDASTCAIA